MTRASTPARPRTSTPTTTSLKARRYAIEIHNNRSHDNTLGYSGTAGNSVWAHDNDFYNNATGIATDSLFPGHPGLPQDHARWSTNKIYSNNRNWYTEFVDKGVCAKPMKERGYMQGAVCPVIPTPVGTGVLIAGGNYNSTDKNWIYDNWRYGTMQFWVPAPLRDEYDPDKLFDTSHHNHTTENKMGLRPDGSKAHNGMDHWWDDQGNGNCWQGNTYSRGHQTDNFTLDPPSCSEGGSVAHARAPGQGRRLPHLQPVRPQRRDLAAPARLRLVRQPEQADGRGPAAGRAAASCRPARRWAWWSVRCSG